MDKLIYKIKGIDKSSTMGTEYNVYEDKDGNKWLYLTKRGVVLETEIFAGGIKKITPKKISASTYLLTGKELKIILESKYFEIIKL